MEPDLADLDQLVGAETLVFAPLHGTFDVEAVAAAIAGIGYSFRDEADPSRFVIASDERGRDTFQARRRADPRARFPYAPLVRATPEQITVSPIGDHHAMREVSLEFLRWLTTTYPVRLVTPPQDDAE